MQQTYRAGAIGHTGRGNFGHQLDMAYQAVSSVALVAVADPDPAGLTAAAARTGAEGLYLDCRAMLEREKLDLVSVGPHWFDKQRAQIVIDCAQAGVKGILCEKPIAGTLAQADAILEACARNGVRMAVAHRRASGYEQYAKQLVEQGEIGEIQVMRGHGKADHRAGAMELMVLGTHVLDSMRFFAGSDVAWAHGHVSTRWCSTACTNHPRRRRLTVPSTMAPTPPSSNISNMTPPRPVRFWTDWG